MNKNKRSCLVRLLLDNKKHFPGLFLLTALMLVSGLFKSYAARFLGLAIDSGVAAQMGDVVRYGILTLLMYGGDAVRLALFNIQTARVVERMFLDIKRQAFDAVAHASLAAYDADMKRGDILSRVTNDLPKLSKRFADTATWLISVFSRGLIALIFCLTVSWKLSAIYVVTLPILILLMNKIGKPIQSIQRKASQNSGSAYGVMSEMLTNNAVVKAFRAERFMDERFGGEVSAQRDQLNLAAKKGSILTLTAYLSDVLLIAVLFLFGGYLLSVGDLTIGQFVMFVTLSGSIREAFDLVDSGISSLREMEALAGRLYEVLDLPSERQNNGLTKPVTQDECIVRMRDLSFAYVPGEDVLKGVSLSIKYGSHVGVIGPSGCGKSTLAKLICGLYQGYDGEFQMFGLPVDQAAPESIRGRIAMVSQNPYLFCGTIAENVQYGNLNATKAQIENALRGAQLWDDVQAFEHGVDTQIGDGGSRLSGGQKQRLAIARALVRDADFILLDEASSALDTKTEREIQRTIDEAFRDKTLLVIVHRFASLSSVDYVYCLDNGVVAEEGDMRDLLLQDSRLRGMALMQGALDGGEDHAR